MPIGEKRGLPCGNWGLINPENAIDLVFIRIIILSKLLRNYVAVWTSKNLAAA